MSGPRTKVLVVDDEPSVRQGLENWLSSRGFDVLAASSLRSALATAIKERPDVVLLDVKLGPEDGLQLVGLLRGVGLAVPCVVLTAHAGPYDGFKARDLGVLELIEKPSSPNAIAAVLQSAVIGKGRHNHLSPAGIDQSKLPESSSLSVQLQPERVGHRLRKAIDYIEARFTDPNLSAGDVADHIAVTPAYLSRMFDESLNKSPSTVINELRIRRAQQLLANARLNLSEIANICGYRSTRQLNGWFTLFCGHRPAHGRLNSGSSRDDGDQETDTNIN